ncbi:MAG: MarC family protein [Rhizobiales bacterium]|nr:MarC family protein [Hyphomicrobiales bacterium]
MLDLALHSFATLFVTADPIGLVPIFIAIAGSHSVADQRAIALRAVVIAGTILIAFAILGDSILTFFGVRIPAFEIAGGMLLFVIGFQMVFSQGEPKREGPAAPPAQADLTQIAVFPLAIPMISGPGSISATVLLATHEDEGFPERVMLIGVILALMALTYAAMLLAHPINRVLGNTGRVVITRLLGVILAAMAIDFIVRGLTKIVQEIGGSLA